MTIETMQGGPFDGKQVDVEPHILRVVFPMARTGASSGIADRSLAEMEPEIRFDPVTFASIAPSDLVTEYVTVAYVRTSDGFVYEETA
jgi:hypothetical protein